MRNFWRNFVGGFSAALFLAAALLTTPVFALTNPPTFAPRAYQTQQVHYYRVSFNLANLPQGCIIVSNTCNFKFGAVPYNSTILRITVVTNVAFNSVTNDLISFGTNTTGTNIVNSGCVMHAQAITSCTVLATASSVTGAGATQTGADGGFDLYMVYVSSGGAATTGNATIVVEYIAPNDGQCTAVPMGATALGC